MRIPVWSVVAVCVMAWGGSVGVAGKVWGSSTADVAAVQGRIVRGVDGSIEPSRGAGLELTLAGKDIAVRDEAGRASGQSREGQEKDKDKDKERSGGQASPAQEGTSEKAPSEKATGKGSPARGHGGDAPVNINTSTADEIEALPGIGPGLAARILEYREKHGPFKRLEDLMNVRGVGEKNFLKLKPSITVGPAKAER